MGALLSFLQNWSKRLDRKSKVGYNENRKLCAVAERSDTDELEQKQSHIKRSRFEH